MSFYYIISIFKLLTFNNRKTFLLFLKIKLIR